MNSTDSTKSKSTIIEIEYTPIVSGLVNQRIEPFQKRLIFILICFLLSQLLSIKNIFQNYKFSYIIGFYHTILLIVIIVLVLPIYSFSNVLRTFHHTLMNNRKIMIMCFAMRVSIIFSSIIFGLKIVTHEFEEESQNSVDSFYVIIEIILHILPILIIGITKFKTCFINCIREKSLLRTWTISCETFSIIYCCSLLGLLSVLILLSQNILLVVLSIFLIIFSVSLQFVPLKINSIIICLGIPIEYEKIIHKNIKFLKTNWKCKMVSTFFWLCDFLSLIGIVKVQLEGQEELNSNVSKITNLMREITK